jgi:Competence-damaged protein
MPTAADDIEFTRVDEALVRQACEVMDLMKRRKLGVVTAESCTAGLLAAMLSEAPGASQWLHGGFVTYTAKNKTAARGIPADLIEREGAVSEAVARAMAEGALIARRPMSQFQSPAWRDRSPTSSARPSASCISPPRGPACPPGTSSGILAISAADRIAMRRSAKRYT